jgi:glycosyltransferase involved in cell wall biosynthesis
MIGRLSAQKDPEFMALLVAQLRETYATLDSVWIGDGEPRLRDRLTQSGIKVTGWLPQDDVVHELDKLKLYVHTAAYEGFPLSVLDVAARRVPIIARRIPALEEAGLRTFDTIAEGVALAKRALADESFRTELQRAGDAMLSRMNTTTQRAALERAWRADA